MVQKARSILSKPDEHESANVLLRWLLYASRQFGNLMSSEWRLKVNALQFLKNNAPPTLDPKLNLTNKVNKSKREVKILAFFFTLLSQV